METNPYVNDDKEQRRRIIIVATTIAVIILGIAVWSIIAIVGGSKKNATTDQPAQVANVDDGKGKSTEISTVPAESNAPATEGVSKTTQNNSTTANKPSTTATAQGAVPETGPEEILPFALVLGGLTAYVSSKKLATREA
ncbi:hypothetical protein IJU22_00760 [Candidatus Saccharibacteria bacterium]|nr:hypothetical protein [Candidatus Saccharibacteria bacterium]